jgi:hypothetical protein
MIRDRVQKQKIAFSNFSRSDVAYIGHFFGSRHVFQLNGLAYNQAAGAWEFSPNVEFLKSGQHLQGLFLLNDEMLCSNSYNGMEDVVMLRGRLGKVIARGSFTYIPIESKESFVFLQKLFSQRPTIKNLRNQFPVEAFTFGDKGIAFGIYALNSPCIAREIHFEVVPMSADSGEALQAMKDWKIWVNGKLGDASVSRLQSKLEVTLRLTPDPAGHVIEFVPNTQAPFQSLTNRGLFQREIGKSKEEETYRIANFKLEDVW